VRARLNGRAGVHFVVADLLAWTPTRQYDVWHDRALFHFLTDAATRAAYLRAAAGAVRSDGALVLGTFADDGPGTCSGLPTSRYTPESLAAQFAELFIEEHREREEHVTPSGNVQPFTWMVLRRVRSC
jgi:hypothetical protein